MGIFQEVLKQIEEDTNDHVMPLTDDELNEKKIKFAFFIDETIRKFNFSSGKNIIAEAQTLKLLIAIRGSINRPNDSEYIGAEKLAQYFEENEKYFTQSKLPLKRLTIQAIRYSLNQNMFDQEESSNNSPQSSENIPNTKMNINGRNSQGEQQIQNIENDADKLIQGKTEPFLLNESERIKKQIELVINDRNIHPMKKLLILAAKDLLSNYPKSYTIENLANYDYAWNQVETKSKNTLSFSRAFQTETDNLINQIEIFLANAEIFTTQFSAENYNKFYNAAMKSYLLQKIETLHSTHSHDKTTQELLTCAKELLANPNDTVLISKYTIALMDCEKNKSSFLGASLPNKELDDIIAEIGRFTANSSLQDNTNVSLQKIRRHIN